MVAAANIFIVTELNHTPSAQYILYITYFVYPLHSRDDFDSSKNLIVHYFFSITHPFGKLKEKIWTFYLFWANIDFVAALVHVKTQPGGRVEITWRPFESPS